MLRIRPELLDIGSHTDAEQDKNNHRDPRIVAFLLLADAGATA